MVKNPPSKTEDVGSVPGQKTKILHAMGQVSPHATTKNWHSQINTEKKKIFFFKEEEEKQKKVALSKYLLGLGDR